MATDKEDPEDEVVSDAGEGVAPLRKKRGGNSTGTYGKVIYTSHELHGRISEAAARRGTYLTEIVRVAVEKWLAENEPDI